MNEILVIDDEPHVRQLVSQMLIKKGYKAILACDGEEGLALFKKHQINLVISDIKMPQKNGIDFLLEMLDIRPSAKAIMISGMDIDTAQNFFNTAQLIGAFQILPKPFTYETLISNVERALGTK